MNPSTEQDHESNRRQNYFPLKRPSTGIKEPVRNSIRPDRKDKLLLARDAAQRDRRFVQHSGA